MVPPSDADVRRVEELERAVVAGQISAAPAPRAATAPPTNITLRLRVHASTARDSPASSSPTPGVRVAPTSRMRRSTSAIAIAAKARVAAVATSRRITSAFAPVAATTPTRTSPARARGATSRAFTAAKCLRRPPPPPSVGLWAALHTRSLRAGGGSDAPSWIDQCSFHRAPGRRGSGVQHCNSRSVAESSSPIGGTATRDLARI